MDPSECRVKEKCARRDSDSCRLCRNGSWQMFEPRWAPFFQSDGLVGDDGLVHLKLDLSQCDTAQELE